MSLNRPLYFLLRSLCMAGLAASLSGAASAQGSAGRQPVRFVGDQRLEIQTSAGLAELAVYASRPMDDAAALAGVDRVVLVVHGQQRNADGSFRAAQKAAAAAGESARHSLLIAPQFLIAADVATHGLKASTLRWSSAGWPSGDAALAPLPISSFEVLDALLARLADRQRFPRLAQVVILGHSAGGQLVQRYAVLGQGESALAALGIALRYAVANPSSYLYFSDRRPQADGRFAAPSVAACPGFNRWKYGWEGAPAYATVMKEAEYEARYIQRDLVYLLGTADTDPNHPALDKNCAAETQGRQRFARGQGYVAFLRSRHAGFAPQLRLVPGVGHDGEAMVRSACAQATMFDDPKAAASCREP